MPEAVGGVWIKSYEFTRSWGVEPASASGTGVIGLGDASAGLGVGEYYAFAFGGITFHGVMSSVEQSCERESGYEYPFQMVDNRVRLGWGMVFGQWNMPEDPDIVHANPFPLPAGTAIDQMSGGRVGFDMGVDFTGGLDGGEVGTANGVDFGSGAFPEDPVLPSGLDPSSKSRGRLYGHIVPNQWPSQIKIYTREPRSAASILAEAFASAVGGFTYALNFHSSQQKPVFNVDANSGMTLAALVSMMCEAQGLQVTLDGVRTLRFSRRGGNVVVPPPPAHVTRIGSAISSEATRVRVVGDRCLVQMNSIDLEPDWRSAWEAFVSEPAWLEEVKRVIENDLLSPTIEDTFAGRAELAARAREMTVAQYIAASGSDTEIAGATTNFADHGRWGKASRMDIPAWTYINSIVFRSYRIPDATLLFGLPMRAMEIHEGLLCAVHLTGTGEESAIQYRQSPVEFYPPGGAFVIAKGQPLDLLDSADREAIVRLRAKDMREQWTEISNFTIDANNHSIHFSSPVFTDGDAAENKSILHFPNKGEGGYEDLSESLDVKSDYLRICVPNPDFEITAASVRVALVFRLGRFYKDFGSGPRWTTASSSSLAEHLLDPSGGSVEHDLVAPYAGELRMPSPLEEGLLEMLYDNGHTAVEEAENQAAGLIVRGGVEQSGSYTRHGEFGTALSGAVNRISISVTREGGVVEVVEFAKPRPTRGFVSSKEIGQRVRTEELFDGQADLARDVRQLKAISNLERISGGDAPRSSSHIVMSDLFKRPIGSESPSATTLADPNSAWPIGRVNGEDAPIAGWRAGDIVWLDDEGLPSATGSAFGGIVVSDSPQSGDGEESAPVKYITVATDGTVPVACAPGLAPGAALVAVPGDWKCTAAGTYPIGMLGHHSPVPGTSEATLALIRLNAGGSAESKIPPLTIVSSRPEYIPEDEAPVAEGYRRFWVTWGLINGVLCENWKVIYDVPVSGADVERWSYIKAFVTTDKSENLRVTHCEMKVANAQPDIPVTPTWPTDGTRPEFVIIPLGHIQVTDGVAHIHNAGGGSIEINEHIGRVASGTSGSSVYLKQFSYRRLVY